MTGGLMASRIAGNPRGSGYRRVDHDWYLEPVEATSALLATERFVGTIYDPACGQGNILKACHQADIVNAYGTDIIYRGGPGRGGVDFLDATLPIREQPDNIICNPPFKLATEFAEQALRVARHKVAFIQRLTFLEGQKRSEFLRSSPLARVYVFANRISMPPGGTDVTPKGGFMAYAWFVWSHDHKGPPTIDWITVDR